MSAWLIGYLAGLVTWPAIVLALLAWALWRNPSAFHLG
jgi:hypothetical protein